MKSSFTLFIGTEMKGKVSAWTPKTKFSVQRTFIVPEAQKTGIKSKNRERGRERGKGTEERGEKGQGRRIRVFVPGDKELPLEREETEVAHRKMAVHKGETLC